jgi:hypothetical protein
MTNLQRGIKQKSPKMEYLRAFKLLSSILTSLEPYESGQAGHQIPTCY